MKLTVAFGARSLFRLQFDWMDSCPFVPANVAFRAIVSDLPAGFYTLRLLLQYGPTPASDAIIVADSLYVSG